MKRRLARAGRAVKWALESPPGKVWQYREWVLQELGLSGLFWRTTHDGAKIAVPRPGILEAEARPLMRPQTVLAPEADHMRDDDVVLGLHLGGEARAYPWWIMDNHHVANDVVGGRAVTILLCEMCSTGMAFDPAVSGRTLTFEQRHIFNGTVTLDDHQTGSIWSPYRAEAIRGPLLGRKLDLLPLWQMEWKAWRELHASTTVLPGELGSRTGHGSNHEIGGPGVGGGMRRSMARWDTRLPHNTLVLGVVTSSGQRAYPLELLRNREGVVNDAIGEVPIVAFGHLARGSYGAMAFDRRVGGRVLTFEPDHAGPVDLETGSRWTIEGLAVQGPLRGTGLRFVKSHVSEWYVWATNFPNLEIAG